MYCYSNFTAVFEQLDIFKGIDIYNRYAVAYNVWLIELQALKKWRLMIHSLDVTVYHFPSLLNIK